MGRPKRSVLATAEETCSPPADLPAAHRIARVRKAAGNNLYSVQLPSQSEILVELPSRFRSTFWIKRDGFVVVDVNALPNRENKLAGEIVNVVREEKHWRKQPYWCVVLPPGKTLLSAVIPRPSEFAKKSMPAWADDDDSIVGKLPPEETSDLDT